MDYSHICLGCMNDKGIAHECPRCGYIEGTPSVPGALEPGVMLGDRYLVGKKLSLNGEGITYIGLDTLKGRKVTVREYMPDSVCSRKSGSHTLVPNEGMKEVFEDYLEDFLECARGVSRLSEVPSIVPVLDIFECNNTAYVVYQYIQGKSLTDIVGRAGQLTWDEARPIFLDLINSLISAHSVGLMHFGINPQNLIMTKEGKLKLIGFGSPDAHLAETDLKPELFDGYSAIEQYAIEGKKGKWTDVYGVCAVMLFALTARRPTSAVERSYEPTLSSLTSLRGQVPDHVISTLSAGLRVDPDERIGTMEELKSALSVRVREDEGNEVFIEEEKRRTPNLSNMSFPQKVVTWVENLNHFQMGIVTALATIIVLGIFMLLLKGPVLACVAGTGGDTEARQKTVIVTDTDTGKKSEMIVVPELVNKDFEESRTEYAYSKIQIILMEEEYSDTVPAGYITYQSVSPNELVPVGTLIQVKVSKGSDTRNIPNIIGMRVAAASTALENEGLKLGVQTEEYSSTVPFGCVIRLSDASVGDKIKVGGTVNVVVSKGKNPLED